MTKSLSVSHGSPSPGPVMVTQLCRETEAGPSRRPGAGHYGTLGREQMYRHTGDMMSGMSHSYTLPHSLSHHSSKNQFHAHYLIEHVSKASASMTTSP